MADSVKIHTKLLGETSVSEVADTYILLKDAAIKATANGSQDRINELLPYIKQMEDVLDPYLKDEKFKSLLGILKIIVDAVFWCVGNSLNGELPKDERVRFGNLVMILNDYARVNIKKELDTIALSRSRSKGIAF